MRKIEREKGAGQGCGRRIKEVEEALVAFFLHGKL
jgi:hypothetical protein